MGKQRSKEGMEKVRQRFVSGAGDRGIDRTTANRVIEEIAAEYKVQGLSSQYHPMQVLRQHISRDGLLKSSEIAKLFSRANVRTASYVVARQAPATARGIVFLTLEDEDGLVNVIVKPQVHRKYRQLIRFEPLLLVERKLQKRDSTVNIVAQRFMALRQHCLHPPLSPESPDSQGTNVAETSSACRCHEHF